MDNESISGLNSDFWDEMCGTNIARQLGITSFDAESLKKFDNWFFDFYPYLFQHLNPVTQKKGKVLEIGLGYGSVGTYLMSKGVKYHGLDIAQGPVGLANIRAAHLGQTGLPAVVGDVLNMSTIDDSHFDAVVAIGSLHHTGDFDRALSEVVRVTKSGGSVIGMVYSLFSLRNWLKQPLILLAALKKYRSPTGARIGADEHLRWMSDHNSSGQAAPATEYFSRRALRKVLSQYGSVNVRARNLDSVGVLGFSFPKIRNILMRTPISRLLGLDLYFELTVVRAQAPSDV